MTETNSTQPAKAKPKTSKTLSLTQAAIERQQKTSIELLNDPSLPLRLRFWKSRKKATIWLIEPYKGSEKWHRIGYWPALKIKGVIDNLETYKRSLLVSGQVDCNAFSRVGDLLTWYKDRSDTDGELSKPRKANIRSVITKHLEPILGKYKLSDIGGDMIEDAFIWPLQNRYPVQTVQQYFKVLKSAFNQAKKSKKISLNPLSDVILSDYLKVKGKSKPKPCKIASHDLDSIFGLMRLMPFEASFLVLTMFCFGTRIGETRRLKISYFEPDKQQWHLPGAITKTEEPLVTPITDWYLEQLKTYRQKQIELNGYSGPYLFPNGKGNPLSENDASDLVRMISKSHWSAHDCRKLFRTELAHHRVDYFVAEQLLNHKMSDLDAAYIHGSLDDLKRDALKKWHFFLAQKST